MIVYTLVETSLESLESSPPAPLTELLRYLATCPAPPVRAAIARFDPPFPAAPEYRELALLYEGKRGSGSSLRTRTPLDYAHTYALTTEPMGFCLRLSSALGSRLLARTYTHIHATHLTQLPQRRTSSGSWTRTRCTRRPPRCASS